MESSGLNPELGNTSSQNSDIVCFLQKSNKMAAASYNVYTLEVKILESTDSFPSDFPLIQRTMTCLAPRLLLYNVNSPRDFVEAVKKSAEDQQCSYQRLPATFFNYANCKDLIFATTFSGIADKFNYINTVLNTADERLVCALGALLAQLRETLPTIGHYSSLEVNLSSISPIKFDDAVWIDSETYKCLQIFDMLQHPSAFKWSNKSTLDNSDGLSMYSLIEKHCSLLGTSKLRNFLSSPTKDLVALNKRHEVIKFCIEPKNAKLVESMKSQMNHISPTYVLMRHLECVDVRGKHWKSIYQNIYYCVLLAETCREITEDIQLFQDVGRSLVDEMYAMAYHLDRIIDFQSMEGSEIFVVKSGVSESLEKAKEKFSKLMNIINKVIPLEFDAVPCYIKKIHMLYIPEMKFLLSIPYWKKSLKKEELELPGLEYKFTSNNTAYYKSKRCYELDSLIGDPQIEIMAEEANIIRALGKYIKTHIHHIISLVEKIAELDCVFALGALAKEYDYTKPSLRKDPGFNIIDGVHPLLKIRNNQFIPNSLQSQPRKSLLKIIYGPNSSGKTVFMKQAALLIYMAHIGSYIPAREAAVGMFSHIHTHLSSSESVISHSSSFMSDLRKLVALIDNCSSSSLLVLDEVGRGTTELNGVAILASCLNYLQSLGAAACPHVLVSTHLSPLQIYLQPSPISSFHLMDYAVEDGKYLFLYKIKNKKSTSNSVEATPMSEIPDHIQVSAKRVLDALRTGEGVTPYTMLRLRKCRRYYAFLKRFSYVDTNREGLIEKIRRKLKSLMA